MVHYACSDTPFNRGVEHFAGEWVPWLSMWRQGQMGVTLFFVLSGFLLTRIYFDKLRNHQVPLRRYLVKRIARIWPLYLVLASLQTILLLAKGVDVGVSPVFTMTLTQGFFTGFIISGLPTAWSLTVEESFYLLLPPMILLIDRLHPRLGTPFAGSNPRRWLRLIAVLGGFTAAIGAAGFLLTWVVETYHLDWRGFLTPHYLVTNRTIFGRFLEFAFGMAAAFAHRDGLLDSAGVRRAAPALAVAAFLAIHMLMWFKNGTTFAHGTTAQLITYFYSVAIMAVTAVLILCLAVPGGPLQRLFSVPLFVYLGKVSYAFYLIQLSEFMPPLHRIADPCGPLRLPVLYLLMTGVSAFCFEVIEKPMRSFIVERWSTARKRVGAKEPTLENG